MPLFCLSIGLTQGQIGIKEAICSTAYLLLNIPTGWIADRISRKACNFIGDAFYGVALVILALSTSFAGATAAGMIMAFGNACTQGADEALFKAHCDKLGKDYVDTRKWLSQANSWIALGYFLAGGILTALYGMKVAILLASIPFFIAAFLSCFIKELGIHKDMATDRPPSLKVRLTTELSGMAKVIRFALHEDKRLMWILITYTVAVVMGGPIMGLVGPMILAVGGSEGIAGTSHVIISAASIFGGWLSRKTFAKWRPFRLFLMASSVSLLIMATASLYLTPWTVNSHHRSTSNTSFNDNHHAATHPRGGTRRHPGHHRLTCR